MTYYQRFKTPEERFWEKVDKSGDCWEWTGVKNHAGYGGIGIDGVMVRAHRAVLLFEGHDIPSGMCVCHTCDNPGCVNPDHLFLATHAENMADKVRKKRTYCGDNHIKAKLASNDIPRIRDMLVCGASKVEIGRVFGVSAAAIWSIDVGRTWAHV